MHWLTGVVPSMYIRMKYYDHKIGSNMLAHFYDVISTSSASCIEKYIVWLIYGTGSQNKGDLPSEKLKLVFYIN